MTNEVRMAESRSDVKGGQESVVRVRSVIARSALEIGATKQSSGRLAGTRDCFGTIVPRNYESFKLLDWGLSAYQKITE